MNNVHRAPGFSFRHDCGAVVEAALDQHRNQKIEACARKPAKKRGGEQERFQIEGAVSHGASISARPWTTSNANGGSRAFSAGTTLPGPLICLPLQNTFFGRGAGF